MNFISAVLTPHKEGAFTSFGLGNAASQSGGEAREDGKLSFGYSLLRGRRQNMEDYFHGQWKKDQRTGETVGLFGIFDGHGGPNAADYVRSNLFINLLQNQKFLSSLPNAVVEAYHNTDSQYLRTDVSSNRDDGCTAVTAVVVGSRLVVANVGDSRAILCRGGQAVALSIDHKPNLKEERDRIEEAGGVVVWAGTWRVGGVLAVSRAFGDRPLKRYVIATPDVNEQQLSTADEFLILASDGVWDVISNQEAVSIIRDITNPEKAARKLSEEALQRGSNDNISCVVVRFRNIGS